MSPKKAPPPQSLAPTLEPILHDNEPKAYKKKVEGDIATQLVNFIDGLSGT